VTNTLSDANPTTTFLACIQRKIRINNLIVNRLLPTEEEQRTDIIHRTCKGLNRNGIILVNAVDVVV
jgi:hypothetical protein